jgi:hypothetical protein
MRALRQKAAPYGKPIGLHEPTKQALGCQFSDGVSILGRGGLTGSKTWSLKSHPSFNVMAIGYLGLHRRSLSFREFRLVGQTAIHKPHGGLTPNVCLESKGS